MKAKISWKKFLLSLRIGILSRISFIFNESRKKVGIQKKMYAWLEFFSFVSINKIVNSSYFREQT